MKLRIVAALFIFSLVASASFGADDATPVSTDDVQQLLNRMKGNSGLYGANPSEMNQFVDMVQTPELADIAGRLRMQLEADRDTVGMSMEEVSSFVRKNLTREDAERILGQAVDSGDFQRGLQMGGDPQNLNTLMQILNSE